MALGDQITFENFLESIGIMPTRLTKQEAMLLAVKLHNRGYLPIRVGDASKRTDWKELYEQFKKFDPMYYRTNNVDYIALNVTRAHKRVIDYQTYRMMVNLNESRSRVRTTKSK